METKRTKLQIGCGIVCLFGYVNIDYPPDRQASQHALPDNQGANEYGGIAMLYNGQE